jgi:hypothetical protein
MAAAGAVYPQELLVAVEADGPDGDTGAPRRFSDVHRSTQVCDVDHFYWNLHPGGVPTVAEVIEHRRK